MPTWCTSTGTRVQYAVYRWNTYWRNFDAPTVTQLGNTNYDHSYPNIDANRNGLIAVTWQQTVTTQVVVSVTSVANFFPSYSFPQTVSFGRTVLATGDITGNFQSCYRDQLTGTVGMYAINPPTGLFEQTLHPDVAISEGDENRAIVSSTFLRHHVDGQELFSIVNELAVVQFPFLGSCRAAEAPNQHIIQLSALAERYWPYSQNNVLGSPRIASPSYDPSTNRLYDVEVAVDRTEANCGPYQYAIWNFGKTNGAFRDEYTMISPLQPPTFKDPNLIKAVEPAISFSAVMPNRNGTVSSNLHHYLHGRTRLSRWGYRRRCMGRKPVRWHSHRHRAERPNRPACRVRAHQPTRRRQSIRSERGGPAHDW